MNRRAFLAGAVGVLASSSAKAACSAMGPPSLMGLPVRCQLSHPIIIKQNCQLWCWAASASMIFAMHGHPLDQMKIVTALYGAPACLTSGPTLNIVSILSANWIDDYGVPFKSIVTGAYDPTNNVYAMNNNFIANELNANRPLLYCNTHHAMVVAGMDFLQTSMGPNVQGIHVLDPWPASPNVHPLSPPEMIALNKGGQMTFLASVQVI